MCSIYVKRLLAITILALSALSFLPRGLPAKIIVFAPHPDDEALMFSGIIYRALAAGEPVRVVVVTNGDKVGGTTRGLERQVETIDAMVNILGMLENDILFLGYPDAGLETVYNYYTSSNDIYVSPYTLMSETYGNRGLGGTDYHTYKFGEPGKYNKPNIIMDLASILSDFLPDHVFVTSEFDTHEDHSATYLYVTEALLYLAEVYPDYRPTVHKTLIHGGDGSLWPTATDPKSLFTPPPLMSTIPLNWNIRESINVPLVMQSDDLTAENLKHVGITSYVTQYSRGNYFLKRFVHKDEFFWAENIFGTNNPPVVEAGGDQSVDAGSPVTLDGTGSLDPDGDPLGYSWMQTQGTSVTLSDPTSPIPSFNAPTGLLADETLEFGLVVNDGEFESIMDTVAVAVTSSYANIAPFSSAVASSEKSATASFASAAIDGYVDGSPSDPSREWASDGELAGTWITLGWPDFYVVDRIVLYDRINSADQIIDATLTFSDGSSIDVGPLANDGGANIINFPMKKVFRVTLTVNEATGQDAGLAEFEVFGAPADAVPHVAVGPASYDFQNVGLHTSSAPQTFTILNTGTADLLVESITITGADAGEFSIAHDAASGQTIGPSEGRTFDVVFGPGTPGPKSATVMVQSQVPDSPAAVSLFGTGVVSKITTTPSSYDFGRIELSTSSPPHAFTVTNTGTGDLLILAIRLSGPDAFEFSIINDAVSGQSIEPSGSRVFEVVFSPSSSTPKSATITIESNDPDTPAANILLNGTGFKSSGSGCSIVGGKMSIEDALAGYGLLIVAGLWWGIRRRKWKK